MTEPLVDVIMESGSVEPIELEEVGDREMLAVSAGGRSPNAATALPIARVSHRLNKFDMFRFNAIPIDILF